MCERGYQDKYLIISVLDGSMLQLMQNIKVMFFIKINV